MKAKIEAAVCSNMGRVRKNNEDNFFMNGFFMDESRRDAGGLFSESFANDPMIFSVCDGMGGTARGEDASLCAVKMYSEYAKGAKHPDDPREIGPVIQNISDEIEKRYRGSGTTTTLVVVNGGYATVIHVGDSRVYTMQNGSIVGVTVDHSEVQRLYSMGLITREEMATHPKRHMINQFLGMPRTEAMVAPTYSQKIPLTNGLRFLLCSDGLCDMVDDMTIQTILASSPTSKEAARNLTQAALSNGGKDNVTVMVLTVYADGGERKAGNETGAKQGKAQADWAPSNALKVLSICGMGVGAVGVCASLLMMIL